MTLPVVAIVGRPNVGKSRLFNRIIGSPMAAVFDRPGVTRDRLYHEAEAFGHRFLAVDTGGFEPKPDTDLLGAMRTQTVVAIEEADVLVFVVDGKRGYLPDDAEVADLLRRTKKPVIVTVNKIDGPGQEDLAADFWQMGLTPLITVSAAHGRGMYELMEAITEALPATDEPPAPSEVDDAHWDLPDEEVEALEDEHFELQEEETGPVRIAVIGRPNIGKSTLVNALLGEERHLVHDMPGTTMDPVDSVLEVDGKPYVLVDTAGVRRRARIDDALERFVSLRSIRAIERCHVSLLLVDATQGITDQDARLAQLVADRGRALILLFNKWDLAKGLEDVSAKAVEDQIEQKLPHAVWAPRLYISAKTKKGIHRVLPLVDKVFAEFDKRISTPELNRFLERAVHGHTPPQRHHHPVRLYYAAQARVRPPTFVFFCNTPEGVEPPYKRYLANKMREAYGFEGAPLRLRFRKRRSIGEDAD